MLAILPQLRRYSRSLTHSGAESEDLLQDCVEKALLHRSAWRGVNLKAWACRIMTNLHLNARRATGRRATVPIDEVGDVPVTNASDPLVRSHLQKAVQALAPEARAVLMLVVVEGYAYGEVAEILGIPEGTVMSRLARSRQILREKMREDNIVPLRRNR